MRTLTLKNRIQGNSTVLDNDFIDEYMIKANGEYVKVYLLLLRHLQCGNTSLTISKMADFLDCTEKDICRAFRYWAKNGLLKIDYDETDTICGLSICRPSGAVEQTPKSERDEEQAVAKTPKATPAAKKTVSKSNSSENQESLRQLYFVAEQYMGRTLSSTDIKKINYFFDELNFSTDLIEYLIEYCVDNGHKTMRYIEAVALKWAEAGITTVEEAKADSLSYNKTHFTILNAFGIKGRGPASVELSYIRRWIDEYGLSLDLIIEACNRTVENTHKPDFKYTDKILQTWMSKDVKHLSDVKALDSEFLQKKESKKHTVANTSSSNRFKNFEGRSYDMSSLEQQLLKTP